MWISWPSCSDTISKRPEGGGQTCECILCCRPIRKSRPLLPSFRRYLAFFLALNPVGTRFCRSGGFWLASPHKQWLYLQNQVPILLPNALYSQTSPTSRTHQKFSPLFDLFHQDGWNNFLAIVYHTLEMHAHESLIGSKFVSPRINM